MPVTPEILDPARLRAAVRYEGGVSRRLFLTYAAALASLPLLSRQANAVQALGAAPSFDGNPFQLGVASGDPDENSVVLWTRLSTKPLDPDGGMPNASLPVTWEIAADEGMKNILKSGTASAAPLFGHSVHVTVNGLKPDTWYWYRFHVGTATSPVGRTRTLPAAGTMPKSLHFAFASCQHYETGYYTAYERMAQDDLDLVFHLGDYIYEGAGHTNSVRTHAAPKLMTLDDYRVRHCQYRSDPLLSGMHAKCPWFVTWDDHEVENDYANDISERLDSDPAEFLIQRSNAYHAYYEMMPLRRRSLPHGPDMQVYRRASYGRLAELILLDTRQYRTDQPNGDKRSELNAAALNPANTLMGDKQKQWVKDDLIASQGRWNVIAQQIMMGMVDQTAGPKQEFSMDQWPGYTHERMEFVQFLADRKIANPVILSGDIHANYVNDLRVDDRKAELPVVAAEFVGTSITSGGDGLDQPKGIETLLSENPCLHFHNRQRGYVRCTVTENEWRSDYVVADKVSVPGGKTSVRASFVIEAGKPGIKTA